MIQAYADGVLFYDSRLDEYRLLELSYTEGVNVSGTASFKMAASHPAFNRFVAYRTEVTIYRDGALLFRGRALTPADDFYNCRTITCEGERGFFLDSVLEPYLYQDSPAAIFAAVIGEHNAQVDDFKRFEVGTVTVTDDNDYVRLESESAATTTAVLDKLVGRCGGYITFTTNASGARVVNWLAELNYANNQALEFGKNLTDYARTDAAVSPITVLAPYGAAAENGERLTIESITGSKYIEDTEAIALRGRIVARVYWDDVTKPENLLRKAEAYLAEHRNLITSLQLSGVDLSLLDKSLDAFRPGDRVQVVSKPHGVDESFLLMEKSEDLITAGAGSITLGKEKKSLTGLGVAGDKQSASDLQRTTEQIRADMQLGIAAAMEETERKLSSLIEQTSEMIRMEVSDTYTTNDRLQASLATTMTQLSDSFTFTFNELRAVVGANDATAREHIVEQASYIRMKDGAIVIGKSDAGSVELTIENDLIVFRKNGEAFGWWDGVDFHTGNIVVEVNERAQFGDFAFTPRSNGSLSFWKVR